MPTIDLLNQDKQKVGSVSLNDAVFAVDVNSALVHQVLKAQLAAQRQGTAKTKTKSEVRGGGKKPFKQKGTGNARQGSTRSPLQPGGGQTFGPRPRCYDQATPKEMVKGALRSVLSDRLKSERLLVVDQFKLDTVKTKTFQQLMKKNFETHRLLIVDQTNRNLELSGRNIPNLKILRPERLTVYDLLRSQWVVLTQGAVQAVETRLDPSRARTNRKTAVEGK